MNDDILEINGRHYVAKDALHTLTDLHIFGLSVTDIANLRRFFMLETGRPATSHHITKVLNA